MIAKMTESIIKLGISSSSMNNTFETKPKKWGNSLGITIPADIVRDNKLDTRKSVRIMLLPPDNSDLKEMFGILKGWPEGKTTQEVLDEMDMEERRAEERRYRRHLRGRRTTDR